MKLINLSILLLIISNQNSLSDAFIYRDEEIIKMILNTSEKTLNFNKYLNNSELFQFITDLHHVYPKLTNVYEIGRSSKNQSLKVLSISKPINSLFRPELKPAIKLLANQYGNEALGRQLLIYLVQVLLENYPHNELIRHLIDTVEIHVLFSMNPDGFDLASEGSCARMNDDSVGKFPDQYDQNSHAFFDPNKTDGFINLWLREGLKFNGKQKNTEKTEPEVEAIEKWTLSNQFLMSLNLRSGLAGVFYPFSNVKKSKDNSIKNVIHLTPDHELFEMLAYSYAFNHPSMNVSECNPLRMFNSIKYPVINSAFYEQSNGSMADYNYFFANCFELTIFQSCCAYPSRTYLKHYWQENKVSLINHLRLVHMGIKGIIRDSVTQKPLEGVFVHVQGNAHITISNKFGEYFRLLASGKYNITFELNDYENVTQSVLVGNLNDFEEITQSVLKNDQFIEIGIFNITMQREIRKILKEKDVHYALQEEAKNCLNKSFEGEYAKIKDDFESVPVFKYHNYSEMVGYLFYYNQIYPNITHLYKIGSTDDSFQKLPYVLVISKNPESHELLKPEFKYSANSFGDQWVGREMLLLLIKHLLESYGRNEEITRLVDTTRIHILASLDPEAFEEEYAKYKMQIKNIEKSKQIDSNVCSANETKINSIDLTFPDVLKTKLFNYKEDERVRILSWIDENVFILSGTLYDGQLLARIPFNVPNPSTTSIDETTIKTSDDQLFIELAKSYVEKNEKMKRSKGCSNDPCTRYYKLDEKISDGIINGAKWKYTQNTYQDYNYLIGACFDLSFFISCERQPNPERLFDYWIENRRSLVNFIGQVHRGVKGLILDEQNRTMNNIELMVDVEGNEKSISIYTKGDYFRLLKPGQYNLSISIQHFYTNKKQITVENDKATIHNFVLKRDLSQSKKSDRTPSVQYLENRVSSIYKKCSKNCGKKSNRFVKYSVIFLVLIALVAIIVYYGQQTASKKLHLRRGFQQLLNNYRSDDSLTLDSEMTLSKIAIVKSNNVNQTDFSNVSNQKNLNEDSIILLDTS